MPAKKSKKAKSAIHPDSAAARILSQMHPDDRDRALHHMKNKGSLMSDTVMKGGIKAVAGKPGAYTKKKGGKIKVSKRNKKSAR